MKSLQLLKTILTPHKHFKQLHGYCKRDLCTKNIINLALVVRIKSQNKIIIYTDFKLNQGSVLIYYLFPVHPIKNKWVENKIISNKLIKNLI